MRARRLGTAAELLLWLLAVAGMAVLLRLGCTRCARAAYPDTYRDTVCAAAQEYGVPPSLVFAVIYTESGFQPDAVSPAGAVGLMQVMEETLDWAVMRTGGDSLTVNDLTDPQTNIRVGTCILSLLSQMFPEEDTALAAYNAGAGNVRAWLADSRCSADGETLAVIPLEETAAYVEKVRRAQEMYQKLYNLE